MIQIDATLKRLELILGLISKEDVIAWADEIITGENAPPFQLYDISLGVRKTTKGLELLLCELGEGSDIASVSVAAFRYFAIARYKELEDGSASPDDIAKRLYEVAWQTDLILPEEHADFTNWIDDEFALVRQGIKKRPSAEITLRDFLRSFIDSEKA
jgi:hypothetical protein